jgi:peptide/nickel transport system permease protein
MIWFALTKFFGLAVTLLVAAGITFLALDLLPGDAARFILGINATPETLAALREQLGLNLPPVERFFGWVGGMLRGDFGISYTQGVQVADLIGGRLGVTVPLTIFAMILSAGIGLPMGLLAARKRGSLADTGLMALSQLGVAVPNFWFGMLLVLLFSVTLRWLPPGGFVPWTDNPTGALAALVLPSLALALPQAAILARVMRTALVDVQGADYIRTARAKGLTMSEAVWRHGVRNAMLPVLTILGLQFAYLIAGTVIVENVFYLPGLGRLIFDAVGARDLATVRACVMILVLAVIGTMFVTDLCYAWADPRLRARSEG